MTPVMSLLRISLIAALSLAICGCGVLFHQRIEPSEVRDLLYLRLGSPLEEVVEELVGMGFQCERPAVQWTEHVNYGCSRYNASSTLAPRGPNDWLDVELLADKGQTKVHSYRIGQHWDKTYARNRNWFGSTR